LPAPIIALSPWTIWRSPANRAPHAVFDRSAKSESGAGGSVSGPSRSATHVYPFTAVARLAARRCSVVATRSRDDLGAQPLCAAGRMSRSRSQPHTRIISRSFAVLPEAQRAILPIGNSLALDYINHQPVLLK
jgi:hypothetical protein